MCPESLCLSSILAHEEHSSFSSLRNLWLRNDIDNLLQSKLLLCEVPCLTRVFLWWSPPLPDWTERPKCRRRRGRGTRGRAWSSPPSRRDMQSRSVPPLTSSRSFWIRNLQGHETTPDCLDVEGMRARTVNSMPLDADVSQEKIAMLGVPAKRIVGGAHVSSKEWE